MAGRCSGAADGLVRSGTGCVFELGVSSVPPETTRPFVLPVTVPVPMEDVPMFDGGPELFALTVCPEMTRAPVLPAALLPVPLDVVPTVVDESWLFASTVCPGMTRAPVRRNALLPVPLDAVPTVVDEPELFALTTCAGLTRAPVLPDALLPVPFEDVTTFDAEIGTVSGMVPLPLPVEMRRDRPTAFAVPVELRGDRLMTFAVRDRRSGSDVPVVAGTKEALRGLELFADGALGGA